MEQDKALHEVVGEHRRLVLDVTEEMAALARAFLVTGNETVARQLRGWIDELYPSAVAVSNSCSMDLYRQVRQAEQSSANLLMAALAGSRITTPEAAP